jgi:hypothetical protein
MVLLLERLSFYQLTNAPEPWFVIVGKLFVKEMGRMTFVADTTALIPCLYGGYPVDQIVWKHNGSEIDTKGNRSRFRILANRTLQIEHTKPGEDRGEFTCLVSNRKGETASGSATVNVLRKENTLHFCCC